MITLDEFVTKYNGKYLDWDKKLGPQCVDLIRYYLNEVLGMPVYSMPAADTARLIFNNFPNNGSPYFIKVYNTPTNAPVKGDIVFWGYPMGFYFDKLMPKWAGHTAICSGSSIWQMITFDQNWGQPNFCRYVNHNYRGVLGWLHAKQ